MQKKSLIRFIGLFENSLIKPTGLRKEFYEK
jgi:hypothetical protein